MCQTYETTISSLKYLDQTKIPMSSMLVILSLSISLLFNYGFGIMNYTSGQINTTQQLQQQQLMNQNESLVNASQMQENGSAGNLSNP